MYTPVLFLLLAGRASLVQAHGFVKTWSVDGVSQPGYTPSNPAVPENENTAERATDNKDNGFADYTSPIVACGGVATEAKVPSWPLKAGSTVTAFWDQWPSHPGPVQEYMALCGTTCQGVGAASLDWFKIASTSWTGTEWASDVISKAPQHDWSFDIPADLAPGAYLVRHEIVAMHSAGTPQVYPVCFQAELSGSGSAKPSDTTTFPAAYDLNDMFKTYVISDVSLDHTSFIPPGPAVYGSGGASGSASEDPVLVAGNGTAAASDADPGSDSTSTPASSQQSSNATTPPASAKAESTGTGGGTEEDSGATSATENKGANTAASSTDKATGSTSPPSTRAGADPGAASPNSDSGSSAQSSGSSGDCMAQMNECKDKINKSGAAPEVVSAGLAACDAEHKC